MSARRYPSNDLRELCGVAMADRGGEAGAAFVGSGVRSLLAAGRFSRTSISAFHAPVVETVWVDA